MRVLTHTHWEHALLWMATSQYWRPLMMRLSSRPALGTLKPGIGADASIFKVLDQPTLYKDAAGESLLGNIRFEAHGLVLAGRWW